MIVMKDIKVVLIDAGHIITTESKLPSIAATANSVLFPNPGSSAKTHFLRDRRN